MENNNKQITTENANCLKFHSTDREKQVLKQQNNFQNSQVLKEMGQENSVVMKGP